MDKPDKNVILEETKTFDVEVCDMDVYNYNKSIIEKYKEKYYKTIDLYFSLCF